MLNITDFFITTAAAETGGFSMAGQQGGGMSFILMMGIFFVFIYFAIWRPQNKRAKEQQNLLKSITKGDEVVVAGGMLGRVIKVADPYVTLGISNNVEIIMQKASIVSLLPKGTLKSIE